MIRHLTAALLVMTLPACTSGLTGHSTAPKPIQSPASAMRCDAAQPHAMGPVQVKEDTTPPTRVSVCIPRYPASMLEREIEARCESLFDLDEAGVPVVRTTQCSVPVANPEIKAQAKDVFEAAAGHAVGEMRFVPLAEEAEGATRADILQVISFKMVYDRPPTEEGTS